MTAVAEALARLEAARDALAHALQIECPIGATVDWREGRPAKLMTGGVVVGHRGGRLIVEWHGASREVRAEQIVGRPR